MIAAGNRVKPTNNGTTTYFVGTHYKVTGSTVTKYYYAGAQRIAMRKYTIPSSMVVEYFLGDHLGSTSITTHNTGAKVSEMRYKPCPLRFTSGMLREGEVRSWWTSALSTTPAYKLPDYTFTGQFSYMDDPSTSGATEGFGLMFYNARWYDPAIGRFTSADSILPILTQGVQAWDRYAFVNNNPVRYTDPTGHAIPCEEGDICQHPNPDPLPNPAPGESGSSGESQDNCQNNDADCLGDVSLPASWSTGVYCINGYCYTDGGTDIFWTLEDLPTMFFAVAGAACMVSGLCPGIAAAASALDATYVQAALVCLRSALCRLLAGAAGGAGSQGIPLLKSGGSNNPRIGPIISRLTGRTTIYYRYWSTALGNESGTWVTTIKTNNGAAAQDLLSLPYRPDAVSRAVVPANFRIQDSLASPLFRNNNGLGHQVELLDSTESVIFEFISLLK